MPRYAERVWADDEHYRVDYARESAITELRRLDLDVGVDDLSDIWLAPTGDLILTEELSSGAAARVMAHQMQRGERFPPVVVRATSGGLLVVDGHHRVEASRLAGYALVPVRELFAAAA